MEQGTAQAIVSVLVVGGAFYFGAIKNNKLLGIAIFAVGAIAGFAKDFLT